MNGIHTLILKNFKAFPEEQKFEFNGKHVLIYGENGSGKSSIYWALYTILQSSIPGKDTAKYFTREHDHSLLNTNTQNDEAFIYLSFKDSPEDWHKLNIRGLENPPATDDALREANLTSDFLSYRLMTSIYNFRHSETIDLFPVFEKDIIPFMQTAALENWNDLYKKILARRPYAEKNSTLRVIKSENTKSLKDFQEEISTFNNLLSDSINKLLQTSNGIDSPNVISKFYNDFFSEEGEEYALDLFFKGMNYGFKKENYQINNIEHKFVSKDFRELVKPEIRLIVRRRVNGVMQKVERPQSFFNEARLTRIALCIRLCIFENRKNLEVATKFLVLDDLLISLDMSNREAVLDLLFKRYMKDLQLIILTHERAFFHLAKRKIEMYLSIENRTKGPEEDTETLENQWKLMEIFDDYDSDLGYSIPRVYPYENLLRKAKRFFKHHDYSACANSLRSYIEEWIIAFLPTNKCKAGDGSNLRGLNNLIVEGARPYFREVGFNIQVLDDLLLYKDVLMNPLSHSSNTYSEIYKNELTAIFKIVEKVLPEIRNEPIIRNKELINLRIGTAEGDVYELYLTIQDDFRLLKDFGGNSMYPAFQTTFVLEKYIKNPDVNSAVTVLKYSNPDKTFQTLYDTLCEVIRNHLRQTPIVEIDMFSVYKTEQGLSIQEMINSMY